MSDVETFEKHRRELPALAYRMLGDMGRAEDAVQEAWLRWQGREETSNGPVTPDRRVTPTRGHDRIRDSWNSPIVKPTSLTGGTRGPGMVPGRQTSESRDARRTETFKRRRSMAREDIEKMIADAIGAAEEPCKPAGSKRLPHAQHILDQYAALCRAGECEEAEPSGEVELPVTASDPAGARSSTDPIPSFTKRMLKRIKR